MSEENVPQNVPRKVPYKFPTLDKGEENNPKNLTINQQRKQPSYSALCRTYGKIVNRPVHPVFVINCTHESIFIGFLHFNNTRHLTSLRDLHIHLRLFMFRSLTYDWSKGEVIDKMWVGWLYQPSLSLSSILPKIKV
jgi:hypothetical protein